MSIFKYKQLFLLHADRQTMLYKIQIDIKYFWGSLLSVEKRVTF
jgi:hypothetical protein